MQALCGLSHAGGSHLRAGHVQAMLQGEFRAQMVQARKVSSGPRWYRHAGEFRAPEGCVHYKLCVGCRMPAGLTCGQDMCKRCCKVSLGSTRRRVQGP